MSDLKIEGNKASDLIVQLSEGLAALSDKDKEALLKKTNGVFELHIVNENKEEGVWTIDAKKTGTVYKGVAQPKADVILTFSDETFVDLATGKINGQKAFMTGKIKIKGNMMLTLKLDNLVKLGNRQAKL